MADIAASGVQAVVSAASNKVAAIASSNDEILKGYLIKALEKTGNLIDKSVDMVTEQAPILVHEVLQWYFAYHLIFFVIGVLGILSVVGWWVWQIRWGAKQRKLSRGEQSRWYKSDYNDITVAELRLIFNMAMVIPLVMCIEQLNLEWLKIWIAPRLWMIEYATHLIKGH